MEEKEKMKLDSKVNIEALIEDIRTYIYENHKQDITGEILQETLVKMAEETGVVYEEMLVRVANSDKSILELAELVDSKTESLANDLEATNTKLDSGLEKTKLDDLVLSQKIDNLASNLVGLGNNIKGEAKGGGVINLPPIALNSVAHSYRIEGLTATQLVTNGDFSAGTKGFTPNGSTLAIKDGVLNVRVDNLWNSIGFYFKITGFKPLDIGYIHLGLDLKKESKMRVGFDTNIVSFTQSKGEPASLTSLYSESTKTVVVYLDAREGCSIGDVYTIANISMLNLTELFGKGNEPTKEWCDEHIQGYFEGVKSVQAPMRIKSVGENLFNPNQKFIEYGQRGNIDWDGKVLTFKRTNGNNYSGPMFKLKTPIGSKVFLSSKGSINTIVMILYDENKNICTGNIATTTNSFMLISQEGINRQESIYDISVSTINNKNFSPYTESNLYINNQLELKSVGSTKDYIENGTLFKNIFTTKEFKKDDVGRQYINESLVNNYAFYFDIDENKWLKDGFVNNNRVAIFSDGETYTCVGSTIATDVEDIVFFVDSGKNYIVLKVNKTKIDKLTGATPLDKFKAYMGNRSLTIDYQANAEQVKLDTSGVVTTHENGTIFIENIKNVTDFYTANGLDVKDFKELVSIYKYEGSDLVQLDASKAVFATTLKHPDLQDGDLVFFEYKYLDSPLWGENTIEYFNQNNVLQSENGKVWRKVEVATNDGQLTTKLEEVK